MAVKDGVLPFPKLMVHFRTLLFLVLVFFLFVSIIHR